MSNNNARRQQSWGHLEESAIAAGAALLPIAMSHKAERTCAGAELFLSGRIQHAVAGEGTGDEELHAKVALLPRIIETLALMLDDAEKAAVWRPEERTAVERLVRVLRDGKNLPLNRETMLPLFHFAGELRRINYGSFGGPPIPVSVCQSMYQQHIIDGDSDRTLRHQLFGMLEDVHRVLAHYMGLPNSDNIVMVDNAGDAFNIVAESVIFNPAFYAHVKGRGTKRPLRIVLTSVIYPMVRNCIFYWLNRHRQLEHTLPEGSLWQYEILTCPVTTEMIRSFNEATDDEPPQLFVDGLADFCIKNEADVVVFDHVASAPAFILPIQAISKKIKSQLPNCFICIDAAHAIGAIPLDFGKPDEPVAYDAWFSNCHKWLMAPKHSAVLWFSDKWRDYLHPTVKSNFYRGTPFFSCPANAKVTEEALMSQSHGMKFNVDSNQGRRRAEFYWRGTRDHSCTMALTDLIWFRRQLGDDRIQKHNRATVIAGAQAMANFWGTELLLTNAKYLPTMASVRLPTNDEREIRHVVERMVTQHSVSLPTFCFDGQQYCRIAAQIFSDVEDFLSAARMFTRCLDDLRVAWMERSPTASAASVSMERLAVPPSEQQCASPIIRGQPAT
jgi:selenocysteine lyase/cysteine desulfurase